MKEGIHPEYKKMLVICSCGNQFEVGSTLSKKELHIEVCDKCHPFYTRKQKIIDTTGRVEKYKQRYTQRPSKPKIEKPAETVATAKKPAKKKTTVSKIIRKPKSTAAHKKSASTSKKTE